MTNFKKVNVFITVVIFGLILNGCMGGSSSIKLTPELKKVVDNNTTLYTQFNIFVDVNKVLSTNYEIGFLLPINSKIILQSVGKNVVKFIYNDREIRLINIEKYTGLNTIQLTNRYFSKNKVDLSRFTNSEQHSINAALISDGMSKNAVLLSRGYPPIHITKTLNRDTWTYWQGTRDKLVVHFNNNRVTKRERGNPSKSKKITRDISSYTPKPSNSKETTQNIPSYSLFSKVKKGMGRRQVVDLIGEGTDSSRFMTGKAFIPFNYGSDKARTVYYYKNEGELQFNMRNRLVEIHYDPSEDGYR